MESTEHQLAEAEADSDGLEQQLPVDLFHEPEGYFKPEQPHSDVSYTLLSGEVLSLRLVGHNPLWVRKR